MQKPFFWLVYLHCSGHPLRTIHMHSRAVSLFKCVVGYCPITKMGGKHVNKKPKTTTKPKEATDKHNEQKKMVGYLKYMAVKKEATPQEKEDAEAGLRIYQGLPAFKKTPFLEKWKATKDNKTTGWMKTFEEDLQKEKIIERDTLRGYFTRQFPVPREGGGKHKHMRLEHLLRSWSNPVAQMFAEASPVQVVDH